MKRGLLLRRFGKSAAISCLVGLVTQGACVRAGFNAGTSEELPHPPDSWQPELESGVVARLVAGQGGLETIRGGDVAVDSAGNVTVVGDFGGTVDLGGGKLTSAGGRDIFVASFGPDGSHRWARPFGGAADDHGLAVVIDDQDNVIVTGDFSNKVDFGDGTLASAGGSDIFVASYTSDGVHRWSRRYGSSCHADVGSSLAASDTGFAVAGWFMCSVDLAGATLKAAAQRDIFVGSFRSRDSLRWGRSFGDSSEDKGRGVALDRDGNVTLIGSFVGDVDFGDGVVTSAGGQDIVIASYSSMGAPRWSKHFGNIGQDYGNSIAIDGANIYATGLFGRTADLDGNILTASGNSLDVFLASFGPGGAHRWSKRFGNGYSESSNAVAVDPSGVCIAGAFRGTVDFGGAKLSSAGGRDLFIACFSSSGAHRWSRRFGQQGDEEAVGLAINDNGDAYVTGRISETSNGLARLVVRLTQ